jgi:hypothetical protein
MTDWQSDDGRMKRGQGAGLPGLGRLRAGLLGVGLLGVGVLVGCQDAASPVAEPEAAGPQAGDMAQADQADSAGLLSAKVDALFRGQSNPEAGSGSGEQGIAIADDPATQPPVLPGTEANGPGANGPGANGLGANSLGTSGLGASGLGASGLGASGLGASEPSSDDPQNSADANRLMARLHELYRMQMDVQTMEQFQQIQAERLEKATQLLATQPSYEFQILAIKSQIDALSWQDGTQQPEAAQRLERRCRELLADSNGEFRRMGMLGLTGAFLRRYARDPSIGVQSLVADIRAVLQNDHDDFELVSELAQAASALFSQGQREAAVSVMKAIRESVQPSQQLPVIGVADSLAAQVAMAEARFDKIMADQVADEAQNLPQLRAGMEQIVASGATVALYNEMIPWMQLFEQQACYRSVDLVAETMDPAYRQLPTGPEIVEVLEALRLIRQRMNLVGQTLDWSQLLDFEGRPFDPRVLADKVVLVTFFSGAADKNQRDQLQFETRMFEELQKSGFAMVGFNVDDDPNAAKDFFATRPPRWHCLRSADSAKLGYASDFAQRSVADRVPYRLLLDRQGRVVHVAVPIERLGRYVNLMMQPVRSE